MQMTLAVCGKMTYLCIVFRKDIEINTKVI